MPAPPRRLLVVKFADIGDALGIEPALAALRQAYPAALIDVLVTPGARQALATCPHISTIIDFDKYLFDDPRGLRRPASLMAAARFLLGLRRRRYDTVVLFHHLSTRWGAAKFGLVSRCTGARRARTVAGLDNGRGGFLTHRALDLGFGGRAEWRYWLDVVAALGIPAPERPPTFVVPAAAQHEADTLLASLPAPTGLLIALHAGVGGYAPLKQWPVERFVTVARQLIAERGATILIAGGPDMTLLGASLARQIGDKAVDLTGRTSLPVLAGLLRRCQLMVGNESGVAHLAAAVGCRTLALFGPTNADAWAPYGARVMTLPHDRSPVHLAIQPGERALALRVDEPCSPCYYTGFVVRARGHCVHRNCLHHLLPTAVGAVAGSLLDTI
jgi:heptosyltransferase-2